MFSLILIFRSLGVLVHANAANLGLPVRFSAEIEAAQINENERRALSDFALSLYQQVEAHRVNEAFARYQSRIAEDKFKSEEALWDIIRERSNPALAIRAGQGLIERLVKAGNLRDAWQVLIYCFEKNDQQYRLASGNSTLQLTAAATNTKEKLISVELLRFFDKDFPKHPETTVALLKAVEFLIADARDTVGAQSYCRIFESNFRKQQKPERFRTCSWRLVSFPDPGQSMTTTCVQRPACVDERADRCIDHCVDG